MTPRPTLEAWQTGITFIEPDVVRYRGVPIDDVIDQWSFPATVWLLLAGTPPDGGQEDAVRRVLVAACDHGLAAPSIAAARTVASTRGAPGAAIAAGLLAFAGPAHGGAAGACAAVLDDLRAQASAWPVPEDEAQALARERIAAGGRLPGFGHPYHQRDPRVKGLMAAELAQDGYRRLVRALEAALVAEKGPRLHMNADSAVAGLLMDAGLRAGVIDLVTTIGRTVGLAAHVHEENSREAPFRAPSLSSIEYVGPA
jgi:citrate synthase